MSKKVNNYNACIFCLRSIKLNPGLSLHNFPKDQALRLKWMEACGFSESDIYPKRKLCSVHFEKNCYTGLNKNVLKRGSIPTLHIKKKCNETVNAPSTPRVHDLIPVQPTSSIDNSAEIQKRKLDLSPDKIMSEEPSSPILITSNTEVIDTPTHKKRKCFVGGIKTPDLATPRRAKRHFNRAKLQVMVQRNKIKVLNQTIRRQKNKLSSLEALLKHLKSTNLLTEAAHDSILV
ncbi:unnamed protein product [Macrosiphum euphorbiae]|uniref:THAP-type domain-containing protein n=1 Tax=Macrosiphum euphorbiae TaxID=13131 RepID=A0AAV0VQN0_9HEMI|nr:unnamed protein product [Macrosiphum euphorbiae]